MEAILLLPRNIFIHHPILTLDVFLSLHQNTDKRKSFFRKNQSKRLPHQHTCHHHNKSFLVRITNLNTLHSQSCYGYQKLVSFLANSSNLRMIYHFAYLVFLGKLIAGPGVTNHLISRLVECFVVRILTNPDNELVSS